MENPEDPEEYPAWAQVEARRKGVHPREIVNPDWEDIATGLDDDLTEGYRPDEDDED